VSDPERQEFWASLCLKHAPGLGLRTSKKILERFGQAAKAVDRAKSWLDLGLVNSQQLQAFLAESWRPQAEEEFANAEDKGIAVLAWSDSRYPQRLREIPDPPVFLYTVGDPGLLDNPGVAMVGSRDCSRYGIELAHRIAMELSEKGLTVISGLAYGIDREAHLGGLTGPGSSIAVMGTGPDLIYPATNRDLWGALAEKGLILSEFPPGTKPHAGNFPLRNRIISGLSLGVLVVEASTRSGSLITARLAMEQGREVFAVPGPVSLKSYRGCHEIINKGAKLVHGSEDILVELKPQLEAFLVEQVLPKPPPHAAHSIAKPYREQVRLVADRPPPKAPSKRGRRPKPAGPSPSRDALSGSAGQAGPISASAPVAKPKRDSKGRGPLTVGGIPALCQPNPTIQCGTSSPLEEDVAGHLAAMGATHIDSLCRVFGRDASEMSRTLVVLELKGVVRRLPGGYYLTA
jgi:DNA processing protein